ncbi:hypothetical protein [Okeania sp. KiyG1]|uniref:hypothetical protein n=1 Tax=Okeania sp. KiyG1 TaxID=2720165 RepID=UPI001922B3EB|nr:hypothetical protein [Okeania sp. KiyG1]GFZ99373.1 hypothetical protein CYANOKiyG1_10840 [Okeania sp. KiyG1]GFZ99389.1 hypothetical protein CYANOKiyG1_10870 [Okeania sp. KiyG1]
MENNNRYNAQKNNTRRSKDELKLNGYSYNKEAFKADISSSRNEPERVNRAVGQGGGFTIAQTTIGGILDRLRILQSVHLEYVEAHGKRLEKRLIENHTHKSKVFEEMQYLEVELVHLLESAEQEDPNEEE